MDLESLRNKLEQNKGKRNQIQILLSEAQNESLVLKRDLRNHEKARELVREIGIKMQEQLQYKISEITTLALNAVFDDPYELDVAFVQKRNKTECELMFKRGETLVKPTKASGVGSVDVAAFALRIVSWAMSNPKTDNVFILDEPFKHLKGFQENINVLKIIRELSNKLGFQIIMIGDERIPKEDVIDNSDRVFEVKMKNRVSKVKQL